MCEPKALASPARTPETTVTPVTRWSTFSEAVLIGEKLFVAVTA